MGFPLFLVVLLGASLGLAQQAQAKNPPTSAWHPVSDILNSTATDAACKTDIANEECILKPSILGGTVPGRRRPQYLMPVEVVGFPHRSDGDWWQLHQPCAQH
jgi:hypothetical protein